MMDRAKKSKIGNGTKARAQGSHRGKNSTKKYKVYLSFARMTDQGVAGDIQDQLKRKGIEVVDFERCQQWYSGASDVGQLYQLIGEADAFIFLHTKEALRGKEARRLKQEYSFAMYYANNAYYEQSDRPKSYPLVRLVLADFLTGEVPPEFISFRSLDYRGPNAFEHSFDRLVHALRPEDPPTRAERQAYVFQEALEANPRREIYSHALREEFSRAFGEHVGPLANRIKQLEELTRAQDNLMTPEIISVKEANAFDDIWVASHSLHNDLYAEEISQSIANNLKKGIRYDYFVPDTALVHDKIRQFRDKFSECFDATGIPQAQNDDRFGTRRQGGFSFYYLDAGVFMPFDELVIYDGENPTHRWGYIQMRYDLAARNTNGEGLIMKVPDKTLNTIVAYLLRYKDRHKPALRFPDETVE